MIEIREREMDSSRHHTQQIEGTTKSTNFSELDSQMEGKLITMKKLVQIPINRNCEELKASGREHATCLMSQHEMGARFCYVDECGFGLYTSRTRGRAVRGLPAKKITGNQRTPHITMLCAISPNEGLIHHTIIVGGVWQSHFDQFIEELFGFDFGQPLVESQGFDKTYIILDNAPCHRGVESRLCETIPTNFELVRLPPYSCELDPIEFTFNSAKVLIFPCKFHIFVYLH